MVVQLFPDCIPFHDTVLALHTYSFPGEHHLFCSLMGSLSKGTASSTRGDLPGPAQVSVLLIHQWNWLQRISYRCWRHYPVHFLSFSFQKLHRAHPLPLWKQWAGAWWTEGQHSGPWTEHKANGPGGPGNDPVQLYSDSCHHHVMRATVPAQAQCRGKVCAAPHLLGSVSICSWERTEHNISLVVWRSVTILILAWCVKSIFYFSFYFWHISWWENIVHLFF